MSFYMFKNMAHIYVYTLPTNLAISFEQSLSAYAFHRKQVFYADFFLISITFLTIHASLLDLTMTVMLMHAN